MYGPVTVSPLALPLLPVADHTANLVAVDDYGLRASVGLTLAELARITAPYGHIVLKSVGDTAALALSAVELGLVPVGLADAAPATVCYEKQYPSAMDE